MKPKQQQSFLSIIHLDRIKKNAQNIDRLTWTNA